MNLRLAVCYVIFAAVLSVMALPQSTAFAGELPKKIKIVIEQKYDGENLEILKKEDVALWFQYVGIATDDDENADGTITITIKGEALGALYYKPSPHYTVSYLYKEEANGRDHEPSTFYYTGADYNGRIILSDKNGTKKAGFSGKMSAPPSIKNDENHDRSNVPFREVILPRFNGEMALLIGKKYGIDPLIVALNDTNCKFRNDAVWALGEIRDPRALEQLIPAFKDPFVNSSAIYALDKIDPKWRQNDITKRVTSELIAVLKDEKATARENAVKKLGEIGDSQAVEPLIAVLTDTNTAVRRNAVWALGKIHDPRAVEPLIAAMNDMDKDIRKSAVEALVEIHDPRAVEFLIAALKDTDKNVRMSVVKALGKIHNSRTVELLIIALKDMDREVRFSAAIALGEMNTQEVQIVKAIQPLIDAMRDPDPEVRQAAAGALSIMTWGAFGDDTAKVQEWWDSNVDQFIHDLNAKKSGDRANAIRALGEIGVQRTVEPLIYSLKDNDPSIRKSASEALEKIDPKWRQNDAVKRIVTEFISALKDKDPKVHKSVIEALQIITLQTFGDDVVKWQEWWDVQKEKE